MKERFAKYPFRGNAHGLTMFEVTHVYQLTPPPPELYTVRYIALNDGVDTLNQTSSMDITPFKHILNETFL